jgi:hypothetical protein
MIKEVTLRHTKKEEDHEKSNNIMINIIRSIEKNRFILQIGTNYHFHLNLREIRELYKKIQYLLSQKKDR